MASTYLFSVRLSLLKLAFLLALAPCCPAQQPADSYRLQVDSRLIDTTLIVRNAQGTLLPNLPQTAFHVREDGVDQTVRYFASQRELPLSIGLILDASGSQDRFFKEHEKEVEGFLSEVMEPRDRAFAVCFGNHLRLVSDWTSSATKIVDGIHRFNKGDHHFPELGPKVDRELGTALYDAVYFSIAEKMERDRGRRRVLVILSDGEENSSEHDLVDAITTAQNNDVLLYVLRTTEHEEAKLNARDRYGIRALNHLTQASGGESFDVRARPAKAIFESIAADLKSLYEIGYYSTNAARDHTFRKVTITVDDGHSVRARAGYTR